MARWKVAFTAGTSLNLNQACPRERRKTCVLCAGGRRQLSVIDMAFITGGLTGLDCSPLGLMVTAVPAIASTISMPVRTIPNMV